MGARKALIAGVAAVAVLLAAVAGYVGYGEQQKRSQHAALIKAVGDTSVDLREALAKAPSAELVSRIEARLQTVHSPRNRELADAVQLYIVSAREIARRRADAARLSAQAAASRQVLASHMAHQSRAASWYRDATTLKSKLENEHGDLGRTLKALEELLGEMPEAQKRLAAAQVPAPLMLEAAVRESARQQARDEAQRAAAELEKARQLAPR